MKQTNKIYLNLSTLFAITTLLIGTIAGNMIFALGDNNYTNSSTLQSVNTSGSNKTTMNMYTCSTSLVCITSVQVLPTHPAIGDTFKIFANVTNNEQKSIWFWKGAGLGEPPGIVPTFNSHIITEPIFGLACPAGLWIKEYIKPGQMVTLSGNPCGIEYKVVSSGTVNGNVTFSYNGGIVEKAFSFKVG